MTDRELLEAAARAAGEHYVNLLSHGKWNPLTDDGDALRLAVKLKMDIYHYAPPIHGSEYVDVALYTGGRIVSEIAAIDPYAATRRAIVRAAAAIGEKK